MVLNIYYKGDLKAYVSKKGEIKFKGLDLNTFLDEALGSIREVELDTGDVIFEKQPAPTEQKLFYLAEKMGFDIKEESTDKSK